MKTLFISDLHLGAKYIPDKKAYEQKICDFLVKNCHDVGHIYLLGDVLDYWYEYRHVVPRGFVRFFGTLAWLSDRGVKITWLTGNHDIWLFDYIRDELNIEVIDTPYIVREIDGKRFILAHGDRIGYNKPSFKLISGLFRNKMCQRLYASLHPRWTVPFALRWSNSSRYSHKNNDNSINTHIERILKDAKTIADDIGNVDFIILGHHHFILDKTLSNGTTRLIVLGDWINYPSYALFAAPDIILSRID